MRVGSGKATGVYMYNIIMYNDTHNGVYYYTEWKTCFMYNYNIIIVASKGSFLVCSMARIFAVYNNYYISVRTSFHKCFKYQHNEIIPHCKININA